MLMKNSTFRLLMVACIVFVASYANAQVKLGDKVEVGQTYVVDETTQSSTLTISFNTNKPASSYEETADTTIFSWSTCQNNKGFQAAVYAADTANAPKVNPNDKFKVRSGRFRSNENPGHVTSVASLQELLMKWQEVNPGSPDSAVYTVNAPSACLFDVDGDTTNQAYGIHPGIYKKLENEVVFRFAGMLLTSDLQFSLDTYDEGNTGKTASYDLEVKFGSIDTTITNFYVTGSGKKEVKVAEAAGLTMDDLSFQSEVHIILKTNGTDTPIQEGVYDPTVVMDDITVTFGLPSWVDPAVGLLEDSTVTNMDAPATGVLNEESTFGIHLQDKNRVASLNIINNLPGNDEYSEPKITFLDTLGVMANDGSGNYTVPVDYTITPSTYNSDNGTWSEPYITIAAPSSGAADDDIMFYFKYTPKSTSAEPETFEINNGIRVWYDYYLKGVEPVAQEWNISDDAFNALGELSADTTINGLTIYADDDKTVTIEENGKSIGGMDFTYRLKFGGSARFTDGVPSARVLAFDVTGNTMITVAAMSSSSSSDRELAIAAGSEDNVIATFPAMGASIGKKDYYYKGGPTTIYMYSPSSGVNVYYIKATPLSMVASKIVYFGATAPGSILPSDSTLIQSLTDAGNDVTYMDDNDAVGTFDYSPYDVVVFGESCSSSKVVPFGTESNYPIPSVVLEPLAPRDGKWGWWDAASDASVYVDDASAATNWNYIDVTTSHYITSNFAWGDMFKYSTAADSGITSHAYGVDLSTVVPEAIGVARNASIADPFRMVWAIPAGSTLGITGVTLQNRMVYCGLHAFTLAGDDDGATNFGTIYATDDFREMFVRMVQWAGGQGDDGEKNPTAVQNVASQSSDVMVYPNPAVDYATVKFTLDNQQMVSLNLFNVMGQKLEIQESQIMTSGTKEIKFSTSSLNRGLYIYQLNIGSKSFAGKLSITR